MITNNWNIVRVKNPHPKKWQGPWFRFQGNNSAGESHYTCLASYIGKDATTAVFKHFKCLKGKSVKLTLNGYVAKSLGLKHGTVWNFSA